MAQQNTIAIIWDFDKTLIPSYMQAPLFKKYGVDEQAFWEEVNALPDQYKSMGIQVNKDTIYLNHMITCAAQGIFPGLNNEILKELGKELEFYPGVISIFKELKEKIANNPKYKIHGIHVEHYIVSTGLSTIIRGSDIMPHVEPDGIWGCEFIEDPIPSKLSQTEIDRKNIIQQTGYIIDNTSKTRAIFEINKGANKHGYIDVNSKMSRQTRRVPFQNMIYVADGPSDVPVFSLLRQHGGKTFAIYPKGNEKAFEQVDALMRDGRIDAYAEADYRKGTQANLWLMKQTEKIAESIYNIYEDELKSSISSPPRHLT